MTIPTTVRAYLLSLEALDRVVARKDTIAGQVNGRLSPKATNPDGSPRLILGTRAKIVAKQQLIAAQEVLLGKLEDTADRKDAELEAAEEAVPVAKEAVKVAKANLDCKVTPAHRKERAGEVFATQYKRLQTRANNAAAQALDLKAEAQKAGFSATKLNQLIKTGTEG